MYRKRWKRVTQMDLLTTTEAEQLFLCVWIWRQVTVSNKIAQIHAITSTLISGPMKSIKVQKIFYSHLYTSEPCSNRLHMTEVLEGLDIPKISEDNRQMLNSLLQLVELTKAIRSMNNNKYPGLYGFFWRNLIWFNCFSYWLISLLPVGVKILVKVSWPQPYQRIKWGLLDSGTQSPTSGFSA